MGKIFIKMPERDKVEEIYLEKGALGIADEFKCSKSTAYKWINFYGIKLINHTRDLTGVKFGRLSVVKKLYKDRNGKTVYLCICSCGNYTETTGNNLVSGTTRSCGCYKIELLHKKKKPHWIRIKRIYDKMVIRCYDKTSKDYENWGGRGISVSDEWLGENGIINFYNWSLNNGYEDGLTIDRIDNNKGYYPDNCRWATYKEQANNTRRNRKVLYNGEKMNLCNFCEIAGMESSHVRYYLDKGYSPEEIIMVKTRRTL